MGRPGRGGRRSGREAGGRGGRSWKVRLRNLVFLLSPVFGELFLQRRTVLGLEQVWNPPISACLQVS